MRGASGRANAATQAHIERRLDAQAQRAERKRIAKVSAQAKRDDKARKLAATAKSRARNLAVETARERILPLDDDAHASFRFYADGKVSTPRGSEVTSKEAGDAFRELYAASVAPPTFYSVLGVAVLSHRRWSVYFVGHKNANGDVQLFDDEASLHSLLYCAARAAGMDYIDCA